MITSYASVLELADKPVLETGASCVQVQVLSLAPNSTNPNPIPIGEGFGFVIYYDYPNFNAKHKN